MHGGSSADKRHSVVKPVNRWIDLTTRVLAGAPLYRYFRVHAENAEIIPRTGPAILVCNHTNLFDPIWIYGLAGRPVYYVATEELFRKPWMRALVSRYGAFPKRKAANDLSAIRSILSVIRYGGIVGIFAEGVRTWDGRNSPVLPATARLVSKMKVPVIACRLEGGYLAYPRWANWWRRIPIAGVFSKLYDAHTIPEDEATILSDITKAIRIRDYELRIDERRYDRGGLAMQLPKLLYRCPNCRTFEGLEVPQSHRRNRIACLSCGSTWSVSVTCRLRPLVRPTARSEGTSMPIHATYRAIKAMPLAPIGNDEVPLQPDERLYLSSRSQQLFAERASRGLRILGCGRLFLTNRRLVFTAEGRILLNVALSGVNSLSVDPGDKLHFVHANRLYRIPIKHESALKWYDTILRCKEDIA